MVLKGGIFLNWDKLRMARGPLQHENLYDFDDIRHQYEMFIGLMPE